MLFTFSLDKWICKRDVEEGYFCMTLTEIMLVKCEMRDSNNNCVGTINILFYIIKHFETLKCTLYFPLKHLTVKSHLKESVQFILRKT